MPFFSIVIPLYNKEKYIIHSLESVRSQNFSDYEIIIVNDGSTDRSEELVMAVCDLPIRYFKTENRGVSNARNLGIEKSTGKYIAFLDADDLWYPHFLEEIYNYIRLFPEQKVFSTASEFEYHGKRMEARYSLKKTGDYEIVDFLKTAYHKSFIFMPVKRAQILFTSASVFRRDIFAEIGLFDTSIKSGEDTDMWIRVGLKYKICFIWKISALYVYDPHSLSRQVTSLEGKPKYIKYLELEATHKDLKRYIDNLRFSLAVKSKLLGDSKTFDYYNKYINKRNLPIRKQLILLLPANGIQHFMLLKEKMIRLMLVYFKEKC